MSQPSVTRPERPSVLAAMSGGVDSSTMAALLVEAGYEVVGVTMALLPEAPGLGEAREHAAKDLQDAREACAALGIAHRTIDLTETFQHRVIEPFCRGYLEGRTPNPCLDCNRHLKIAALQRLRRELGLDYVATGHYARVGFDEGQERWVLRQAADRAKDQSYVLFRLGQEDLAHLLLPLGELTKGEVRALAAQQGLASAERPESQDICFVPDGDYARFIEEQASWTARPDGREGSGRPAQGSGLAAQGSACSASACSRTGRGRQPQPPSPLPRALGDRRTLEPGPIVDGCGTVLGTHRGVARYTVGQRKGLGVAAPHPLYVCAKDAATNTLVVGPAEETLARRVEARDVGFVSAAALDGPMAVTAKTHYRQAPQPATAWQEGERLVVEFDEPQRRAAPGQALVVYAGDRLLAGGTIVRGSSPGA